MKYAVLILAFVTVVALAACGGGSPSSSPIPLQSPGSASNSSGTTASAAFLVLVPAASGPASAKRRPAFVAPSGTQAVQITLQSVNGVPYTGAPAIAGLPAVETLSSTTPGCELNNGQLACSVNVSGLPIGTLIFQVDTYASTWSSPATPPAPSGEGLIQVVTVAGQTTNVTAQLGGSSVSSLAIMLDGIAELGEAVSLPVIIEAFDSNGAVIIGTYSAPLSVTVTDTDATGQTTLSNATQQLTGSSSTTNVMLNYLGGAMSSAATIGASAAGITTVTPATFLPDASVPFVNGPTTLAYSIAYGDCVENSPPPAPTPGATPTTAVVTVTTGQTFNGVSNLIEITGLRQPTAGSPDGLSMNADVCCGDYIDDNMAAYFAWTPQGTNSTSLGYVGLSDTTLDSGNATGTETCASPYSQQLVIPFPATWNVLSGAGTCTYVYNEDSGNYIVTGTFNSDGSYTDSQNGGNGIYVVNNVSQSNGNAELSESCFGNGETLTVPAPSPGASLVPATFAVGTASPEPTTAPNPWVAFASDGATTLGATPTALNTVPTPLEGDNFMTQQTAPTALPASCPVPASILGTQPSLSETIETLTYADPMNDFNPNYVTNVIDHYYLNGVGEVCTIANQSIWTMDGGMYRWYEDSDNSVDAFSTTTTTWVTETQLVATQSRVRNFARALPATIHAFSAASYMLLHNAHSQRTRHRATQGTLGYYHRFSVH